MSKIKELRERMEEEAFYNHSKQEEWDLFYVGLAQYMSRRSKDPSTKTGAVIVRPDKSVASVGYNGFPRGMEDTPELYANREEKLSRIIHCEMNALMYAREPVRGYTLYTYPFISCDRCYAHMAQAGITRFVAPYPTPAQTERWGAAFEKVRREAAKMNLEIEEIEFE